MIGTKKLALFATAGMLSISLTVGGATYALFSDSATNGNNNFTAGTVIIDQDRDMGDNIPGPMFYSASSDPTGAYPYDTNTNSYAPPGGEAFGGWAPGDTVTRAMNIYNRGTLTVKVTKLRANVNSAGVTSGAAYEEFISKMNVKVLYPAQNKTLYNGPLSGLLNGDKDIPVFLIQTNGGAANITFEAHLDNSAGNVIQGKKFVFDFTFTAEQLRNNP
jgi:predicted ribosomally synthesized peptide with SipW-like signal peptide